MMKHNLSINKFCLFALSALALAACATAPKTREAAAEQARAEDGMDLALVGASRAVDGEPCPAKSSAELSSRALVSGASACARARDWKSAERIAGDLARKDLTSPWAPYFMSLAAEAAGEAPRALWMAELAQKKAGHDVALFRYQRGRALLLIGQASEGFAEIEAASRAEPRLVEAHLYVAETMMRDLDAKKAEQAYRRALAAEPANPRALRGLALARAAQGDDAEAQKLSAQAAHAEAGGKHAFNDSQKGGGK